MSSPLTSPVATRELDAAAITDPALRFGYLINRRLNARHGRTYFLATLLLPAGKRPHVHALYGFARRADDIVDEAGTADTSEIRRRFDRWCDDAIVELEWGASSDLAMRAVIDTISRFDIPLTYFADFLDSMRMDLDVTGYATYEDLEKYMWGSAAVIGLEMLPILGRAEGSDGDPVPWDRLEKHAIDLGIAFQLTNFLRDVAEDLRRGRVYLPQDSLDAFGVDRERLRRGIADEPIRNLLAWEIERTRALYRSARAGIDLVDPSSRDCLRTAHALYGEILDEIERNDYDVFSRRVSVGLGRRAVVGAGGFRRAMKARRSG